MKRGRQTNLALWLVAIGSDPPRRAFNGGGRIALNQTVLRPWISLGDDDILEPMETHFQPRYRDRRDAGQRLARRLAEYRVDPAAVVYAIPRGGVPVGFEVAVVLGKPLDVVVVRKLGHPWEPELAIGAIAPGGVRFVNREFGLPDAVIEVIAARETKEMRRRERAYRDNRSPIDPAGRTAIVVDDGLATGWSMRAAIASLRARDARHIVVAVPVGARSTCDVISHECDRLVCPSRPLSFGGVGEWYEHFDQTSDDEVLRLLALANPASAAAIVTRR